jgi:MFS family permease
LAWGFLQPFAGALAVRIGYRPLMMTGAVLYILGMTLLCLAQGLLGVILGAGVAIGAAMACNGSAIAMAVASRPVSPALRSTVLGIVSAAGSLGALMAAPIGQLLSQAHGWRVGVGGFVVMALIILPAAWYAGRVDALPVPPSPHGEKDNAPDMARFALKHPPFAVMTLAYFVCGMQLVFLTTHLPSYLDLCGMDPMLSAQALGMIGGFNVLGSLFFGWAGGRYNKLLLLGGIYVLRSFGLAWYFLSVPTPENTLGVRRHHGLFVAGCGAIGDRLYRRNLWPALASHARRHRLHEPPAGQFHGGFGGRFGVRCDGLLQPGGASGRALGLAGRHAANGFCAAHRVATWPAQNGLNRSATARGSSSDLTCPAAWPPALS